MPFPVFPSMDEVPEAFRDEYELVDGKAQPRELTGLKSAVAKERTEREAAAKALREAQTRLEELETAAKAKKSGMSDEQLAAMRADFDAKVAPYQTRAEKAEARLREKELDGALKSLMATSGVRAERIDTLWKLVADRFDLADGGTPFVKSDPTTDVTKTVAGLVKEYPEFFSAPAGSGGGAPLSRGAMAKGTDLGALVMSNPMALLDMANAA